MEAISSRSLFDELHKSFSTDTRRNMLAYLLSTDLSFEGQETGYASHNFHAFAAKFPPQLPRIFIENLTQPGQTVLDPMAGSGTTIVATFLTGRKAIGIDIDPLALRICRVKTTPIDPQSITVAGNNVLRRARVIASEIDIEAELKSRFNKEIKKFLDYWFLPKIQRDLLALIIAIEEENDQTARQFLELVFSSIILTKSGGVSLTRDLAHSRPHRVEKRNPKDPFIQFNMRLMKSIKGLAALPSSCLPADIYKGDARSLPLPDESVDLIITSPPYANAIDYMRAHKFSLVWFGETIDSLSDLRGKYIGSERLNYECNKELPVTTMEILKTLAKLDRRKSLITEKYFCEMRQAIKEMHRVLIPETAAIIVVGTSRMRGIDVKIHICLAEIAEQEGFEVVLIYWS